MPEGKKLLFTSIGLGAGGVRDSYTYNFVTKEMETLVRRGFDVYFFHERFTQPETINGVKCLGGRWFSAVRRSRILWVVLQSLSQFFKPLAMDPRRTLWAVKINLVIADLVTELKVDVVHSHFFYPLGLNGTILKKCVDVPVVSTLRGAELHNRPDLDYGACRDPLYQYFLAQGLKSADYVTAPNPELVRMLTDLHGADVDKVSLVPNGFEHIEADLKPVDEFNPRTLNLLSIGNCITLKNHHLVIESVKTLYRDYGIDLRLVIVGRGVLTAELRALCEDAPITIVEEMKKPALASYLKQADALVHASLLEGMPNVVLEALSMGTPCFASDISAHRMLIQPQVNGYLFDPRDVTSLTELLLTAAKDKSVLASMSESCVENSKTYSLERKIDRYEQIYKILLSTSEKG